MPAGEFVCIKCGNSQQIADCNTRPNSTFYMVQQVIASGSNGENLFPMICFKCQYVSVFSGRVNGEIEVYKTQPLDPEIYSLARGYAVEQGHRNAVAKIDGTNIGKRSRKVNKTADSWEVESGIDVEEIFHSLKKKMKGFKHRIEKATGVKNGNAVIGIGVLVSVLLTATVMNNFGYQSFQECKLEELKQCGESTVCASAAIGFCGKEFPLRPTAWWQDGIDYKWTYNNRQLKITNYQNQTIHEVYLVKRSKNCLDGPELLKYRTIFGGKTKTFNFPQDIDLTRAKLCVRSRTR